VDDVAVCAVGMDAGADHGRACRAHALAQGRDRARRLSGPPRDRRGELDHRRVRVRLRGPLGLRHGEALEHLDRGVRQRVRLRVDEQQLVLEAERELRRGAEARRREGVVGHAA
jgi:hypothetical protein